MVVSAYQVIERRAIIIAWCFFGRVRSFDSDASILKSRSGMKSTQNFDEGVVLSIDIANNLALM